MSRKKVLMFHKTHFASFLLLISTSCFGQEVSSLPSDVGALYVRKIDPSISDDFNSATLDTRKWGRRNTGGASVADHVEDESLVVMESEKTDDNTSTRYVSIKATAKDGSPRTAGIVSRASGYFGFYVVKFRYRGLGSPEVVKRKTIWHPSVWAGEMDHTDGKRKSIVNGGHWLEIDFVEWETQRHAWSSDAPARLIDSKGVRRKVKTKEPGMEKAIMKDEVAIHDDRWQTVGLEYTSEYLRLWRWNDGRWESYSDRQVTFVDDDPKVPESKYTKTTIGANAAQPAFWLLGNVVSRYLIPQIADGSTKYSMDDMSFDIDFFRYYRHKSIENSDWKWENQLPKGGQSIRQSLIEVPQR